MSCVVSVCSHMHMASLSSPDCCDCRQSSLLYVTSCHSHVNPLYTCFAPKSGRIRRCGLLHWSQTFFVAFRFSHMRLRLSFFTRHMYSTGVPLQGREATWNTHKTQIPMGSDPGSARPPANTPRIRPVSRLPYMARPSPQPNRHAQGGQSRRRRPRPGPGFCPIASPL